MSKPTWTLNHERWPIAMLHVVGGEAEEEPDFESFVGGLDDLMQKQGPMVLLLDIRRARPNPTRRQRLVQWAQDNAQAFLKRVIAIAVVAPEAEQRGLVTAFGWFVQSPLPVEVFSTLQSAVDWADGQLRQGQP